MVIFLENLWCIYYYHEVPDEEKKELLLSWILPQFTTSQNLLHVISGELRKIGSSEQKIEMIFFAAPTGPNFLFFILLLNSVKFFS